MSRRKPPPTRQLSAEPPPAPAGRARVASRVGLIVAALVVIALVVVTVVTVRRSVIMARIQAELPVEPDLAGKAEGLSPRVAAAYQHTRSWATALAGVAELGRLYHANSYRTEAEACWRVLLREEAKEPRWPYFLSVLLQFDGRTAEAADLLERTLQLSPDYAPAWLQLAELKFKSSDFAAAETSYTRRLALVPADPYAGLGLARIDLLRGQRGDAELRLETIVRETPGFSPAVNVLAELLAARGEEAGADRLRWQGRLAGRFHEADDPWLNELRAWCFDPSQLAVWGKIMALAKTGDRGKALLERAVEVAPQNPVGHEALGEWYLNNGDVALALQAFTAAVQLPRPSMSLFVNLAETFRKLHEPAQSLRAIQLGLTAMPGAAELYYELGVVYEELGRTEEAIAAYGTAIARSPNSAAAHVNLATIDLKAGRAKEAVENLQLALRAQPTMPKALAMLGEMEMEAGRMDSAAQYLRPLYRFYPGMPRAIRAMAHWHVLTGSAWAEKNRFEEAEREYQHALAIDPESVDAHGKLGVLYGQNGRFTEALASFQAVHRLQPADPRPTVFIGMTYAQLGRKNDARQILAEGEQLAMKAGNAEMAARCRELLRRLDE